MSVKCELNLLKQPSNNRIVTTSTSQVIYFRGASLFSLETGTGKTAAQIELDVPGVKS